MKAKCVIIEDEPKAMNLLQDYVGQVDFLELKKSFSSALSGLNYINANNIDLVFLDINLPDFSGMELSGLLDKDCKIIFTSAYSEFAVQSYEKNTLDYLLKPITFTRFYQAVNKMKVNINEQELNKGAIERKHGDAFFVKDGKKLIQLRWSDILYAEGMKEYLVLVTKMAKTIVYKRMKEFVELQPPNFSRVHRSYTVNRNFIEKIENNQIFVVGKAIPIGQKYKEDFILELNKKLLG